MVAPVYTYYWTAYQTLLERGYRVDFTMVRMKRGKQEDDEAPAATWCSTTGADPCRDALARAPPPRSAAAALTVALLAGVPPLGPAPVAAHAIVLESVPRA